MKKPEHFTEERPEVEGRYLAVEEIALELDLPLAYVRRAVEQLHEIPKKDAESPKPGRDRRLYHESGFELILRYAERRKLRENVPETLGEAVGRSRKDLIQLERKLKALAGKAKAIRGLLGKHKLVTPSIIHSLPHPQLGLKHPLTLTIEHLDGSTWRAGLADLAISEQGRSRSAAIQKLTRSLISSFELLEQDPDRGPQTWERLQQIIYRRPPPRPPSFAPGPAVLEATEPPPTFEEWKEIHEPETEEGIVRAWRAGATACFSGESDCPYRAPRLIQGWRRGYQSLKRYVESGGLFSCASCCQVMRATAVTASQKGKHDE